MTDARTTKPARRLAFALAVVAVLTGWVALGLDAGGGPRKKVALTPDLAWVPPDAGLFVQIRAADVWASEPGKVLRERFADDLARLQRDVEKELGIDVAEMEKVTIVISSLERTFGRRGRGEGKIELKPLPPLKDFKEEKLPELKPPECGGKDGKGDPQEFDGGDPDLFIVTAANADAVKRFRTRVEEGGREQKHKGQVYYLEPDRGRHAFHFVDARTYVRGPVRAIVAGLDRGARATDSGPLAPALEKALAKHHLVAGIQLAGDGSRRAIAGLFEDTRDEGVRRALAPLAAATAGTLWADAGKESRAEAELYFPDEASAKRGLHAGQDALHVLRIVALGGGIAHLERELEQGIDPKREAQTVFGIRALERLEDALRSPKVERRGTVVHAAARADTDLAVISTKPAGTSPGLRRRSANNLKQIMLGTINFADSMRGNMPPAAIVSKKDGTPLLSWRVAILPYINENKLYEQFNFDEPWDSAHNKKLLEKMPSVYAPAGVETKEPYVTFYRGFVAAPGNRFKTAWQIRRDDKSPFGAWGARFPASFTDGTSNTIGVVEAGEAVPWTKPDELVFDEQKPLPKLGGLFGGGFNAAMMDGSILLINARHDVPTLRAMITADGGEAVDTSRVNR